MFGLRMGNQFIMNIDVNTTNIQFRNKLQQLPGINNVTVLYNNLNDTESSFGNRICTSKGKNVTITYNNVTFPETNGNVPDLELSITNEFVDLRSGLDLGTAAGQGAGDLRGVYQSYVPYISYRTLQQGLQKADGTAYYSYGSGSNTITFAYTVQSGDFTNQLEVRSINFDTGFVFGNVTGANVSTSVPSFGSGPRYMSIECI
jgi:hypothetical protein